MVEEKNCHRKMKKKRKRKNLNRMDDDWPPLFDSSLSSPVVGSTSVKIEVGLLHHQ